MRAIQNKLRGQSGLTLAFSVIVFLISAIFAMTVIDSALTAIQNTKSQMEAERAYLAVTSAARFVRAKVEAAHTPWLTVNATDPKDLKLNSASAVDGNDRAVTRVVIHEKPTEDNGYQSLGTETVFRPAAGDDADGEVDAVLSLMLRAATLEGGEVQSVDATFSEVLPEDGDPEDGDPNSARLPTVNVKFYADAGRNYDVRAVFTDEKNLYSITVVFKAVTDESSAYETYTRVVRGDGGVELDTVEESYLKYELTQIKWTAEYAG